MGTDVVAYVPVFSPVLGHGMIDRPGLRVIQGDGISVLADRAECRVVSAVELLVNARCAANGEFVVSPPSKGIRRLPFQAQGEYAFETRLRCADAGIGKLIPRICIKEIFVLIDIHAEVPAEIERRRVKDPRPATEFRMLDLKRERVSTTR